VSAEQHGLSYSALHGEPLNILTKQLDAQARFAKLTDRSAVAQDHVTTPNGRIDYTAGAGAKWIANRSIGMYYYESLDIRNGSRFTYIANAYDAIKQNVELEIYQTLVPSVPTSMYIAVDVAGFWPLYYTPQVYQGIDPYFGGNAFLIPFAYEYVGSDLFVEISAEPSEKRKYINNTFSLGDHVLYRANY
jgi:hypothetical protein